MLRQCVILLMTLVSCAAIPKAGGKSELQRLIRLPQIDFPSPINFDRVTGFSVFPLLGSAAADAAERLREAKGLPADGSLFLEAARVFASGGDIANSIRQYARAADSFARRMQTEPTNPEALMGAAEALAALGRFGEAQATLEKASAADSDLPELSLAFARFYQEKAWSSFAGEENRFTSSTFLQVLEGLVRRGEGSRIEAARKEIKLAEARFERAARHLEADSEFLCARSSFRAFRSVLEAAFVQIQRGENTSRALRKSLFVKSAVEDLRRAADSENAEPALIASAIFASAVAEANADDPFGVWPQLNSAGRQEASELCRRLVTIAESGSKQAAAAAEYLGSVQMYLMKDFSGAERNFRAALRAEPLRERSWELLVYSIFAAGDLARLVTTCEERSSALPNARSSAFLIKSYDRQGDALRAQWTALSAATIYPQDFYVNLSLAALLLKRDDVSAVLWRAGDALNRAEKQMGPAPSRDSQIAFIVLKSIYLALSDQPEQAKALLMPFAEPGRARPEIEELLRALES